MPPPANPGMLQLARESRELSQAELARRLRVPQSKISKAEAGLLELSEEQVGAVARELDYPASFFYWEDRVYGFASHEMFHRRRQKISARTLSRLHAEMNFAQIQVRHLLRSVVIEADEFSRIDPDEYDGDVEAVARATRGAWRLPPGPIKNMTGVIEGAGGVVMVHDFKTRQVDAISQWLPDLPPVFLVNTEAPGDRLRLTLAHEIGHVIMHSTTTPTVEDEANKFAQEFLMPAHEIRHLLQDISLPHLADLKRYWNVSMAALARRAYDLGTITYRQYRRFCMHMTQLGYRKAEPIEVPIERPRTYRELLNLHMAELSYSPSELAEFVGETRVERIFGDTEQGKLRLVN
jgi:Zn-dependent peptidase ImmA (M78 family)/transcriptional regulator with XRE-family HTH domain